MTRTRASAKAAGTTFETSSPTNRPTPVDHRIDRRRLSGANDRGDLTGFRYGGQRVVVECKDYGGRYQVGPWLVEVEAERGNDDAGVGLVVAKRRGTRNPGEQVVFMTLADLVSLITGARPGAGQS